MHELPQREMLSQKEDETGDGWRGEEKGVFDTIVAIRGSGSDRELESALAMSYALLRFSNAWEFRSQIQESQRGRGQPSQAYHSRRAGSLFVVSTVIVIKTPMIQ